MTTAPSPLALREAANRLLVALKAHSSDEYRLALLKKLIRRLGEEGYPIFIRLLLIIGESHDVQAKRMVADTFASALRHMDMPAGVLNSWGASRLPDATAIIPAGGFASQLFSAVPRRQLGPIEFLIVWHSQQTQRRPLGADILVNTLAALVDLLNSHPDMSALYPRRLEAEASHELEGAYTRLTRIRLSAVGSTWAAGRASREVAGSGLLLR